MTAKDEQSLDRSARRRTRLQRLWTKLFYQWAPRDHAGKHCVLYCEHASDIRRYSAPRHSAKAWRVGDEIRVFDSDPARYREVMDKLRAVRRHASRKVNQAAKAWREGHMLFRSEAWWRAQLGLPAPRAPTQTASRQPELPDAPGEPPGRPQGPLLEEVLR